MLELILMTIGLTFPDLSLLYWGCGSLGGIFIIFSMLTLGGGDADVDVDGDVSFDVDADADFDVDVSADADADLDVDMHAETGEALAGAHGGMMSLATWMSARFIIYFLAVFGIMGLILQYTTSMAPGLVFGISLISGVIAGQAVHQLFRALKRTSGNSAARVSDFLEKSGRVTIAIDSPRKGEVAVHVDSGERFLPALAKHADRNFKVGDEVVVVAYQGGIAEVVSREEFDFITKSD